MAHFHELHGGAMADDKRLINSKTSYTLKALPMSVLEFYFNSPEVPSSMKDKLYEAIELKGQTMKGGLKGVSKASGFIRRLMWENKNKHSGSYKNPTWELAKDSKMSKKEKFDYRKLATKSQGGLRDENDRYGASPFIKAHFQGKVPLSVKRPETEAQKEARKVFSKRETVAPIKEEEASRILNSHFGNVPETGRPGSPVPPSVPVEEPKAPKKRTVLKLKKAPKEEVKEEVKEEPKEEVKDGSSSYVLSAEELPTSTGKIMKALDGYKELKTLVEGMLSKNPGYWVAQFVPREDYKVFVDGIGEMGWGVKTVPAWVDMVVKSEGIERNKVNPSIYGKRLKTLYNDIETWRKGFKAHFAEDALPVIKNLSGKSDYPLYPAYLANEEGHDRMNYPSDRSKKMWKEFYRLTMRLRADIPLQEVLLLTSMGRSDTFEKRDDENYKKMMPLIKRLIENMDALDTKEKVIKRNQNVLDWVNFQIDWREEYKKSSGLNKPLPVPHTPDEVGWIAPEPEVKTGGSKLPGGSDWISDIKKMREDRLKADREELARLEIASQQVRDEYNALAKISSERALTDAETAEWKKVSQRAKKVSEDVMNNSVANQNQKKVAEATLKVITKNSNLQGWGRPGSSIPLMCGN